MTRSPCNRCSNRVKDEPEMRKATPMMRLSLGAHKPFGQPLFAAHARRALSRSRRGRTQGRERLCESLAVACSLAAERDDAAMVRQVVRSVVDRSPEILSAAVRRADGTMLVTSATMRGVGTREWVSNPRRPTCACPSCLVISRGARSRFGIVPCSTSRFSVGWGLTGTAGGFHRGGRLRDFFPLFAIGFASFRPGESGRRAATGAGHVEHGDGRCSAAGQGRANRFGQRRLRADGGHSGRVATWPEGFRALRPGTPNFSHGRKSCRGPRRSTTASPNAGRFLRLRSGAGTAAQQCFRQLDIHPRRRRHLPRRGWPRSTT